MTQGAPRTTRKTAPKPKARPNPLVRESASDQELDLDQWLGTRGLVGKRVMKVAGEPFEFVRAATGAQLTAHNEARGKGDVITAMAALLVDPDRADALTEAFDRQRQPITPDGISDYLAAMLNFVVFGTTDPLGSEEEKAGESGAS
ncbi:hypothetical protein [Amycolatopsis circi]|uniref:hypothetical protein n=1 Tax=Amycolatopsis circi TaxID=871959 RepID=UPI000E250E72|nr:hypothetical protein [Amycolatopsis circi]